MGSNDYFVHPQAIGRFLDVTADLETVTVSLDGRCVGSHPRSWDAGQTITGPDHVEAARTLRKAFQNPEPAGDASGLRDLADYDRRPGLFSMTGRSPDDRGQGNRRPDRVLLAGDEGTKDPRSGSQARGPGPRRGFANEEYLAAVLSLQVAAREASGAESRARAAGFAFVNRWRTSASTTSPVSNATPSRTWPPARSSARPPTSFCSARPGPAKPTSRPVWGCGPPSWATGSC